MAVFPQRLPFGCRAQMAGLIFLQVSKKDLTVASVLQQPQKRERERERLSAKKLGLAVSGVLPCLRRRVPHIWDKVSGGSQKENPAKPSLDTLC